MIEHPALPAGPGHMPLALVEWPLLGGLLVAAVLWSVWMLRRRRHVWRRFARSLGLRYTDGDDNPVASGVVGGRLLELRRGSGSSDQGELGIETLRMSVEVRGDLPGDFEARRGGAWVHTAADAAGGRLIETGDEDFDARVVVQGDQPDAVRAYLTAERRRIVLELLDVGGASASCGIAGALLFLRQREMVSNLETLRGQARVLLETAPVMDGAGVAAS